MLLRRMPREIIERVERVVEYHRSTKLTPESIRANPPLLDPSTKPSPYRVFEDHPSIPLPTNLLDAPTPVVPLLKEGVDAVHDSMKNPPQDLRTLASWLYLANGLTAQAVTTSIPHQRTCPSAGALYPCEIYVAAFAIEGLDPGLYHYDVKNFALTKMREGVATLGTIKRGRPDLNFLKNVPATLLISTIYWRSAWRYRQRGYRMALLDAGHLVQNLVTAANGLGIQTMPRLHINDKSMRELIGIHAGMDFGSLESVQAMVVWADQAKTPKLDGAPYTARDPLPRIKRGVLSQNYVPYGSIIATHDDCVAPGITVREVRPPLTELTPIPQDWLAAAPPYSKPPPDGPPVREVLLRRRSTRSFAERSMSRDSFLAVNRLAFRGGSVVPMMPDGPHVALLRPFWFVNLVAGMDSGIWYYDPTSDRIACISRGNYHSDVAYLCTEQALCGQASAVCFLMADLQTLTNGAGPDAYRLTHLEAGIMGQRVYLAAAAMTLGACGIGAFYDDLVRKALALDTTGWETIYAIAVGVPAGR